MKIKNTISILIIVVLFAVIPSLNAQDYSKKIKYDSTGKLLLPSSVTNEELKFFGTESGYIVTRGVPSDSSSIFFGKPADHRNAEIIRVSSKHEYTNLMDQAWTVMLYKQRIIPLIDTKQVLKALKNSYADTKSLISGKTSNFQKPGKSAESQLKMLLGGDGDLASIPQIGRTQQEPMARMQLRDKQLDVIEGTHSLLEILLDIIERNAETIMPGMTHMAHAQPTTYGAYLLSVYDGYSRALEQLELAYKHTNENSAGCGATSGTGWNVDRNLITELLGFDKLVEPAYDGEAGQDYAMTTLFALSNMMLTLSRTSMDHGIWGMDGYYTHLLANNYRDCSSFMPQKAMGGSTWETVRISVNDVLGSMMIGVIALDGEPLADVLTAYQAAYLSRSAGAIGALCETEMINAVFKDMMNTMLIDKEKLLQLTKDGWGCTPDLASKLTREKGYGMRQAHHICGVMVRIAREHRNIKPSELTGDMLDEAAHISSAKEPKLNTQEIQDIMDPVKFIARHNNLGDPNPGETKRMVKIRRKLLDESKQHQVERRQKVEMGYKKLNKQVDEILSL